MADFELKQTGEEVQKILDERADVTNKINKGYTILEDGFSLYKEHDLQQKEVLKLSKEEIIFPAKQVIAGRGEYQVFKFVDIDNLGGVGMVVTYDSIKGDFNIEYEGLEVNKIMLPGKPGAGVGLCPDEYLAPLGLEKLPKTHSPNSEEFGNYKHTKSGSIMVYIPKHYVKYTNDTSIPYRGFKVEISDVPKNGYFLPRVFINAGKEVPGIFVDKYNCSSSKDYNVVGGTPISIPNAIPAVSNMNNKLLTVKQSVITAIKNGSRLLTEEITDADLEQNTVNNMSVNVNIAKSRGINFFITPYYLFPMLNDLSDACWQKAYEMQQLGRIFNMTELCAWADREPYRPRGNNNYGKDIDDASVIYTQDGKESGRCLTASVSNENFAKITHNGQKCGITDLNSNVWEHGNGMYFNYIFKESTDIRKVFYEDIKSNVVANNNLFESFSYHNGWGDNTSIFLGNGTQMPWTGETNRDTKEYKLQSIGFTNITQGSRHIRYGNRLYYSKNAGNINILFGASWDCTSYAGPRCSHCCYYFADSYANVAFRLSLYPLT